MYAWRFLRCPRKADPGPTIAVFSLRYAQTPFDARCSGCPVDDRLFAQRQTPKPKPEDTEVWTPVPKIVTPGATDAAPPSDAIVLFDGKNEDEWVSAQDHTPAQWVVHDGILTVNKARRGNIETKRKFKDYQLHLEWRIPENITGSGQARGNSGVFLASHRARATRATSCRCSTPTTTRPM